jgi:hypothetical protein
MHAHLYKRRLIDISALAVLHIPDCIHFVYFLMRIAIPESHSYLHCLSGSLNL